MLFATSVPLILQVNDLLNKPPVGRAAARGSATDARAASNFNSSAAGIPNLGGSSDELGALGGLDQNQLMQLLSLMNHVCFNFGLI